MMKTCDWTLVNGGAHAETTDVATGTVGLNATYYWLTAAYIAGALDRSKGRMLGFYAATPKRICVGVSNTAAAQYWNAFTHCITLKDGGVFTVYELGVSKYASAYNSGSASIQVDTSGTVTYYINGTLVYTSATKAQDGFYWVNGGGYYLWDPTNTAGASTNTGNCTNMYYGDFAGGAARPSNGQGFPLGSG